MADSYYPDSTAAKRPVGKLLSCQKFFATETHRLELKIENRLGAVIPPERDKSSNDPTRAGDEKSFKKKKHLSSRPCKLPGNLAPINRR